MNETTQINCISIRVPYSYLLCAGVKKVEIRSRKTNYRGWIYVQSSGKTQDYIDHDYLPFKLQKEHDDYDMKLIENDKVSPELWGIFRLNWLADQFYEQSKEKNKLYFLAGCIPGKIHIKDCVFGITDEYKNTQYEIWMDAESWNYIVDDAVLFENVIPYVKGKLQIPFQKELPEKIICERESNIIEM